MGSTGHAEAIKIEFDHVQASIRDLMTVFFATHGPMTLNRQGNDVGTQYRSANSSRQKDYSEKFYANNQSQPYCQYMIPPMRS